MHIDARRRKLCMRLSSPGGAGVADVLEAAEQNDFSAHRGYVSPTLVFAGAGGHEGTGQPHPDGARNRGRRHGRTAAAHISFGTGTDSGLFSQFSTTRTYKGLEMPIEFK